MTYQISAYEFIDEPRLTKMPKLGRRKRCSSCKDFIEARSVAYHYSRWLEKRIDDSTGYGCEYLLAGKWLCERCADIAFSLTLPRHQGGQAYDWDEINLSDNLKNLAAVMSMDGNVLEKKQWIGSRRKMLKDRERGCAGVGILG